MNPPAATAGSGKTFPGSSTFHVSPPVAADTACATIRPPCDSDPNITTTPDTRSGLPTQSPTMSSQRLCPLLESIANNLESLFQKYPPQNNTASPSTAGVLASE